MTRTTKRFRAGASLSHSGKEANPMTEETHRFTITVSDVLVNRRTNGDGFEYEKVKELLVVFVKNALEMSSDTLITGFSVIDLKDEVIE